jgi:CRP-like cAMP-binding protein
LFGSVAGPPLAELAMRARTRTITGELFALGASGETMYVVIGGTLAARRGGEERQIGAGEILGELAVLSHAPRAASATAVGGAAEVLEIERAAFTAVGLRAPELVLGLAATLAGWLAPTRPDVL